MKKNKKLLLTIFTILTLLPFCVKAEENSIEDINMYIKDIAYGETPEMSINVVAQHLQYTSIPVTWYESPNGIDYTLMEEDSTFDYNIYYKVVFGKTFAELNEAMDEGWETHNIYLEIYNNEDLVDRKKYTASDTFEYI